jgi:hypothetical protein
MAHRAISKFVPLGVLVLLVFVLGFMLLVVAARLFMPNIGGFAFGISVRVLTIALVAFSMTVAGALFFIVRSLRRVKRPS